MSSSDGSQFAIAAARTLEDQSAQGIAIRNSEHIFTLILNNSARTANPQRYANNSSSNGIGMVDIVLYL